MLDLYRRHLKDPKKCPNNALGKAFTQCACPVWVDGTHPITGKRVRRSIGTRDWGRAKRLLDRWESDAKSAEHPAQKVITVPAAIKAYLADCRRRKLAPGTIRNRTNSLTHFQNFAAAHQIPDISELTIVHVRDFCTERSESPGRREKTISSRTQRKELEHVRTFCEFCVENEWLAANRARKVKPPANTSRPTLPFTRLQVTQLLGAIDKIDNHYKIGVGRARLRARGLVLLMLYSGMRISDVVSLKRDRIDAKGRLLVRMEKTGEPLYVRLPRVVMQALHAIPAESDYFLWSGTSALATATGSARRTITCLAKHTKIHAHPHRFRDTFAVELLLSGASMHTVQRLLGHTSISTTEEHYAPWVREFQKQMDRATGKLKFA